MISKSTNNNLRTKVIEATITETRTRSVTVEVPIDASDFDENLLYELSQISPDDLGEIDDVRVDISETHGRAEYRIDMQDGRWHVTALNCETPAWRRLADLHSWIVKYQKDHADLRYNQVIVSMEDRLLPGCIYYRPGYSVVVAAMAEGHCTGILRGFDRCYPALAEGGPLMWELVDELDEFGQSSAMDLLERAAEEWAELKQLMSAERPFVVSVATVVHPTPRTAVNANELYRRFQPNSDAADMTA